MELFLERTAEYLYKNHKESFKDICVVFPNKRAGLFLQKYLSEKIAHPVWMPDIKTISEFINDYSDLSIADNIILISRLYLVYKKITKTNEPFDDFYKWGEMLLNDFDDIDKYLVKASDLFKNLESIKEIEKNFTYLSEEQINAIKYFWSNFNKTSPLNKEEFTKIWNHLHAIYDQFRNHLRSEKLAYTGLIYRDVTELIEQKKLNTHYKKIIFIGFNALNKCEEKILKHFEVHEKAEFIWDYDKYYMELPLHQAGYFLRKNIKNFPQAGIDLNENSFKNKKELNAYSAASDIAQIQLCNKLIEKIDPSEYEDTAIILGNEELLIPLLNGLSSKIKKKNITMGYPIKNTPAFSLINHILQLQKKIKTAKKQQFYYNDVLNIINHQYLINYAGNKELKDTILQKNIIYLKPEQFKDDALLKLIFQKIEDPYKINKYLKDIIQYLIDLQIITIDDGTKIESEYFYHLFLMFNKMDVIINDIQNHISFEIYLKILLHQISNLRIPFEGEPLEGLQIMGLLESRVLDFKNVVILSVNEGNLPATSVASSFIPYNLRKGFDLQTIEYQDAIFAHAFYRLIQRAENIHLVYTSGSDLNKGEKSRFIQQLLYESPHKIKEISVKTDINITPSKPIEIHSNSEIQKILSSYYSEEEKPKLSPSAINTFLDCKLKFYFKYITKLYEPDEVSEEIDHMIFGNLFHDSMEALYKPYINKEITKDILAGILSNNDVIEKSILNSFRKNYFKNLNSDEQVELNGRNILIYEVIYKYITGLLKHDQNYAPFEIISLEKDYVFNFPIDINGKKINVKCYGKIDRIDKKKNLIRILDYKTGGDELKFPSIESLFEKEKKGRNSAAFQTFLYSLLFKLNVNEDYIIKPGLIKAKDLATKYNTELIFNPDRQTKIPVNDINGYINEFQDHLKKVLIDIFSTENYTQVQDDIKICEYCAYNQICGR